MPALLVQLQFMLHDLLDHVPVPPKMDATLMHASDWLKFKISNVCAVALGTSEQSKSVRKPAKANLH